MYIHYSFIGLRVPFSEGPKCKTVSSRGACRVSGMDIRFITALCFEVDVLVGSDALAWVMRSLVNHVTKYSKYRAGIHKYKLNITPWDHKQTNIHAYIYYYLLVANSGNPRPSRTSNRHKLRAFRFVSRSNTSLSHPKPTSLFDEPL